MKQNVLKFYLFILSQIAREINFTFMYKSECNYTLEMIESKSHQKY